MCAERFLAGALALLLGALLLGVGLVGCTGELNRSRSLIDDGGDDVDTGVATADTATTTPDTTPNQPDTGGDASSLDLGTDVPDSGQSPGDAGTDAEPPGPCETITCGVHAHCLVDACVCDEGFQMSGSDCEAEEVVEPASHTKAEVCRRYQESASVSPNYFVAGTSGQCDPGTLTQAGIADSVRRLSFYRWLCGLAPVSATNNTYNNQAQYCAVTSAWNAANISAHNPDPSATCYTAEGADGASTSNIAWGRSMSGPSLIDQFIDDWGNDTTLGHRRWCLMPSLGQVGVGIYHNSQTQYGSAGCLKVISTGGGGGSPPPAGYIAYPPAGFVPRALASGTLWSLSNSGITGDVTVTMTEMSTSTVMPVTMKPLTGNYGGLETLAWALQGWTPEANEVYKVEVTDGTDTVTYEVKPVDC
jgi:hypothetical protein